MARNRKYRSAALRFGPSLKAFLLCLLIGGSGVGYVWQKSQINDLGKQILKRERQMSELEQQNEKLRKQLATMRSPRALDASVKKMNLGLGPAQPGQVSKLDEPQGDTPKRTAEREYAARSPSGTQVP